jgi:hypothetical protein
MLSLQEDLNDTISKLQENDKKSREDNAFIDVINKIDSFINLIIINV